MADQFQNKSIDEIVKLTGPNGAEDTQQQVAQFKAAGFDVSNISQQMRAAAELEERLKQLEQAGSKESLRTS